MAQNTKEMLSLTKCILIIMFCNKVKRDAKKVLLIIFLSKHKETKFPRSFIVWSFHLHQHNAINADSHLEVVF